MEIQFHHLGERRLGYNEHGEPYGWEVTLCRPDQAVVFTAAPLTVLGTTYPATVLGEEEAIQLSRIADARPEHAGFPATFRVTTAERPNRDDVDAILHSSADHSECVPGKCTTTAGTTSHVKALHTFAGLDGTALTAELSVISEPGEPDSPPEVVFTIHDEGNPERVHELFVCPLDEAEALHTTLGDMLSKSGPVGAPTAS